MPLLEPTFPLQIWHPRIDCGAGCLGGQLDRQTEQEDNNTTLRNQPHRHLPEIAVESCHQTRC